MIVVIVTYAAGVAITTAATSAYITDITRRARYGAAHGVFGTIYDIGDALGPIAAGILVARLGYAQMFQVMAAVAMTMAIVFVITHSRGDDSTGAMTSGATLGQRGKERYANASLLVLFVVFGCNHATCRARLEKSISPRTGWTHPRKDSSLATRQTWVHQASG